MALVLAGALSLQFGAALAASLFPMAGPLGVVTLRLGVAAVVLLAVARPAVRGYGRRDWAVVISFGLALAAMNASFYQAIDRVPLGVAVTLEFLGPLGLAVVGSRRLVDLVWVALAGTGVLLLGEAGTAGDAGSLDPLGVGFALLAGACWAAYILLAARAGARFPRADGLALAMAIGAVAVLPFGVVDAGAALLDTRVLLLGAGVALLSSVLPYTLELMALRRLSPGTFGVLMSLEPAVAALAGWLVLDQALGAWQSLAIALVVVAGAGAVRSGRPADAGPRSRPAAEEGADG
ncbi:inner membrane transporter RhtA [Allostreptomyces psammosilenae]|uniref:Inner membrane transporter RhtA n=1 Tax=Allostreptomyces psammosilenae TaxID=1892865 RepID=A0A853A1Z6_9ACTN|nr:inner membrane transporter RhtA [Allostreptomyces psammosilenae]